MFQIFHITLTSFVILTASNICIFTFYKPQSYTLTSHQYFEGKSHLCHPYLYLFLYDGWGSIVISFNNRTFKLKYLKAKWFSNHQSIQLGEDLFQSYRIKYFIAQIPNSPMGNLRCFGQHKIFTLYYYQWFSLCHARVKSKRKYSLVRKNSHGIRWKQKDTVVISVKR